jgi:hypothetical protein
MQRNFNQPGAVLWHAHLARDHGRGRPCHDNCLTFLAANGRRFLAPDNAALVFSYEIR